MNWFDKDKLAPELPEDVEITVLRSQTYDDDATATMHFRTAKMLLADINHWHTLFEGPTARFQLVDADGRKLEGTIAKGLFVRIDVPGPGALAGNGYDWVRIEQVEEGGDEELSYLAFQVRPSANPENPDEEVAHFFAAEATSTFVVKKEGRKLTCAVYERNLKANTDVGTADSVRNAFVGNMAAMGLSRLQWEQLVEALLR